MSSIWLVLAERAHSGTKPTIPINAQNNVLYLWRQTTIVIFLYLLHIQKDLFKKLFIWQRDTIDIVVISLQCTYTGVTKQSQ